MSTVELKFACPRCSYICDTASSMGFLELTPKPGDLGLCLKCAAPLEYATDLTLRWLTIAEVLRLGPKRFAEISTVIMMILTLRPSGVRVCEQKTSKLPS